MSSPIRLLVALVCTLVWPVSAHAQGLKFFKNYFLTGGHYAAGVSLKDRGVGNITINADSTGTSGVPADADIVAAFLYWQTVTTASGNGTAGATFNGHPLTTGGGTIAKLLNPSGTPPCWSSGGATGNGSGTHQMKAYRADVMPFLPEIEIAPNQRKRTAIGTHSVILPESPNGAVVPSTAGATLVVIYRKAGLELASTVIYDGGFTLNHGSPSMTQPLLGWYQAQDGGSLASLTQIVANGQPNFTEAVTFKNESGSTLFTRSNVFNGPAWDTYTEHFTLTGGSKSATVTVERGATSGSFDCLSWGAMILTTKVQDADRDGIVDRLESSSDSGQITDPNTGEKLPDLYAMGARVGIPDIFIEFGMMRSTPGWSKASYQSVAAGHTHAPDVSALEMVARAFRTAPTQINVHFDLGGAIPNNLSATDWSNCPTVALASWKVECAIIPLTYPGTSTRLADGGEFIEETPCVIGGAQTSCLFSAYPAPLTCAAVATTCDFAAYPGTVAWKSGFRAYRDEPLSHRKANGSLNDGGPDEAACIVAETAVRNGTAAASTNCRRRFARNREDIFHYVLWAHALGLPRTDGNPGPRNTSGIGDYLGADFMMSLGLWDFATGTPFMQASTFLHELGHNLGLRHGGLSDQPNCKPNYQSVMNYLFQVRGLINLQGLAEIGFSKQELKPLNESLLKEGDGLTTTGGAAMNYRTRWYTSWQDSFVDKQLTISQVSKRCNGSPVVGESMARVDGQTITGAIDWNADGLNQGSATLPPQDLNFSGSEETLAKGTNDWSILNLQTVGSRRNVGGWSAESGYWDTGYWDTGSDPGYWDTGYWDTGYWDTGYWDTGYWDSGYWDTGVENEQDPSVPLGELELDTAGAVGNAPGSVTAAPSGNRNVLIRWSVPNVGAENVDFYEVYRLEGQAITATNLAARVPIGGPTVPAGTTEVIDPDTKNNVWYIYIVLAQFKPAGTDPPVRSGIAATPPFRR